MNKSLNNSKRAKNDEFYTHLSDIEAEILSYPDYRKYFEGRTVYCNCDDPERSAFWTFFRDHFDDLRLKKVIFTYYDPNGSYAYTWDGDYIGGCIVNFKRTPLAGDGDFRSGECIELLKEADIVVTNPPFSLFREFIAQLDRYGRDFLVIGNMNDFTTKDIFPLVMDGRIRAGYNKVKEFDTPIPGETKTLGYACWFTNLDIDKYNDPVALTQRYSGNEYRYPKYDNFDAIEVGRVKDIPYDYDGLMGVPVSFLEKYCPDQFAIVGEAAHGRDNEYDLFLPVVDGKEKYKRLVIRNLQVVGASGDLAGSVTDRKGRYVENPGRFYIDGRRKYDRVVIRYTPEKNTVS